MEPAQPSHLDHAPGVGPGRPLLLGGRGLGRQGRWVAAALLEGQAELVGLSRLETLVLEELLELGGLFG